MDAIESFRVRFVVKIQRKDFRNITMIAAHALDGHMPATAALSYGQRSAPKMALGKRADLSVTLRGQICGQSHQNP